MGAGSVYVAVATPPLVDPIKTGNETGVPPAASVTTNVTFPVGVPAKVDVIVAVKVIEVPAAWLAGLMKAVAKESVLLVATVCTVTLSGAEVLCEYAKLGVIAPR